MSRFSPFNVLIVEDDAIAQMTLKSMLSEMGFKEVFVSSSKKEALTIIENGKIDIALLDVFIDDSRVGIELALEINEMSDVPILFLTGSSDSETAEGIGRSRNFGVLEKPYDYDSIEKRLAQILEVDR